MRGRSTGLLSRLGSRCLWLGGVGIPGGGMSGAQSLGYRYRLGALEIMGLPLGSGQSASGRGLDPTPGFPGSKSSRYRYRLLPHIFATLAKACTHPAKEQICSEVVAPWTYKEVTNETGFGDGRRDGLFQPGFG